MPPRIAPPEVACSLTCDGITDRGRISDFIMNADEAKDYGIVDEVILTRELAQVPQVAGVS